LVYFPPGRVAVDYGQGPAGGGSYGDAGAEGDEAEVGEVERGEGAVMFEGGGVTGLGGLDRVLEVA